MKKKKKVIIVLSIIISLIMIVLVGYIFISKNNKAKPKEIKEVKVEKKKKVKEKKKVQIIDLDSNTRPIAVMINNISTVWGYQSGLQDAYLVYEIIVEGGYTRLMAVFKDKNLDRIGSVRSSRHYFLDYALESDAVYVHFGFSPQAQNDIGALGVNNINFMYYDGYTRDYSLGLASEHTAFTSTEKIKAGMENYGYASTTNQTPLLNYSAEEIDLSKKEGVMPANKVWIGYSYARNTSYQYDSELKVYKRFQNDIEHNDYVTKEQYTTKNIIVYKVDNYTISGDNKGRQDINNIGSGEGYYISNGYAVPITWTKDSRSSKTVYKYLNGEEIIVNDGNTYIQIMPSSQNLNIEP